MAKLFQRARYVYINSKSLAAKSALDKVVSRPGIRCNRNKIIFPHNLLPINVGDHTPVRRTATLAFVQELALSRSRRFGPAMLRESAPLCLGNEKENSND